MSEKAKKIVEIIEAEIGPRLASHGGGIEFRSFDEDSGELKVALTGACGTCPYALETLRVQVEQVIKASVEGVNTVSRED